MGILEKIRQRFRREPPVEEQEGDLPIPDGDPPATLEDILNCRDWLVVFFDYIRKCSREDSPSSGQGPETCSNIFANYLFKTDNMESFKLSLTDMNNDLQEVLTGIVEDFLQYIIKKRRVEPRRDCHVDCDCHRALAKARQIIQAHENKNTVL